MKKRTLYIVPLFLLVISGTYNYLSNEQKDLLNPSRSTFDVFDDHLDGGNTKITLKDTFSDILTFKYKLKGQLQFPYCGTRISLKSPMYRENFEQLDLIIKSDRGKRISIVFGVKPQESSNTHSLEIPFEYLLDVSKEDKKYSIYLKDFKIPDWWLKEHNHNIPLLTNEISYFNVQNCVLLDKEVVDIIYLSSFKIKKNSWLETYLTIVLSFIFYFIVFIIKRKQKTVKIEFMPAKITEETNHGEKILNYITDHYSNGNLSIDLLQKELGISKTKISSCIKEKTGLSFKQFLNETRINAAKKVLLESDSPISDIAYLVGYENISHFNRTFKQIVGIPPKSFKKEG